MRLVIGKVGELQGATKICLSVKKPGEVAGVTGRGAAPSSSGGFSTLEKHCGGVSFSINFFIWGKGVYVICRLSVCRTPNVDVGLSLP